MSNENVAKARLREIKWNPGRKQWEDVGGGEDLEVQFNPQTLKLTYANENRGGDQPGGSGKQFVGSGTSKLAVDLLFDTTDSGADVRKTTGRVAHFMGAKTQPSQNNKRVPPAVAFLWGSVILRGVMDSMSETLEYFSAEGVPLRATVSIGIGRRGIEFEFDSGASAAKGGPAAPGPEGGVPGSTPRTPARQGDSVPRMAGREGAGGDWKSIAAANGIDDPLHLSAGMSIDLSARVGVDAGASVGVAAGASARIRTGG